jgi:sporulation-control protein
VDVEYVAVGLVTHDEVEFHRQRLTGSFKLDAGARHQIDFRFDLPWETPITEVYGQHLHGMTMGLTTELEVAREVVSSDLDPVAVHPVPAQERILDALLRLGFRFSRADVEPGRVHGVAQELPFHQEIEFHPPAAYASGIDRIELTFVATPRVLQVVLEMDERAGRFDVDYATVEQIDWAAQLDGWLRRRGT